jgi:hypothetical protein
VCVNDYISAVVCQHVSPFNSVSSWVVTFGCNYA